jgi:hypothetical protein
MKVHNSRHVYETLPPYLNNRVLPPEQQIVLGLTVVPASEQDAFSRDRERTFATFALDKAQEEVDKIHRQMVQRHYKFCRGLQIEGVNDDGRDLTLDELVADGPPEVVAWMSKAIHSTTELTLAERKNYLPGFVTPSASASAAPGPTADAATSATATSATATTENG